MRTLLVPLQVRNTWVVLASSCKTSKYLICILLLFLTHTWVVTCFLVLSILTSKSNSDTLLVACLPLNTLFVPFFWQFYFYMHQAHLTCCSLTFKLISKYTMYTLLIFIRYKRMLYLSCCCLAFKNINRTFLLTSKPLNTLPATYFMHLNLRSRPAYIACCILTWKNIIGTLLLAF